MNDEPDPGRHDRAEWQWVSEWRSSREPAAWGPGAAVAAFTMLLVASAIYVLTSGVADTTWLAISLNVIVAGGIAPQLWLARAMPVLRFVAWGAAIGLLVGWIACTVVPFPTR